MSQNKLVVKPFERPILFVRYSEVEDQKAEGGLSAEDAAERSNEWSLLGFDCETEVDQSKEDIPGDRTYVVRGKRTLVGISEEDLRRALADVEASKAEDQNVERARKKIRKKS